MTLLKKGERGHFDKIKKANREGYVGMLPNGSLVDRREQPEAHPVAANSMFMVAKPRCIGCHKETAIDSLKDSLCKQCQKEKK